MVKRGINICAKNPRAANNLLGKNAFAFNSPLTCLIIQITGDDDEFVSARLQEFRHLEMTRVAWFVR